MVCCHMLHDIHEWNAGRLELSLCCVVCMDGTSGRLAGCQRVSAGAGACLLLCGEDEARRSGVDTSG